MRETVSGRADFVLAAPAQEAVEYETLTMTHNLDNSTSKYRGEPSPAVDAAWDELLQCPSISFLPPLLPSFPIPSHFN